jgi:hypothetical protein
MSIDDLQAQLRGALDQQFASLRQRYDESIAEVRRQATAAAERDAAARFQSARAEWDSALGSIIETARAETRQQVEESARAQRLALEQQLQQQLEQTVQHTLNSVRKTSELEIETLRRRIDEDVLAERQRGDAALQAAVEAERVRMQVAFETERQQAQQALETHRQRALQDLEAERSRAKTELETVQQLLEADILSARAEAAAAHESAAKAAIEIQATAARAATEAADAKSATGAAGAATPALAPVLTGVPEALHAIDAASSLSQTLDTLLQHAGVMAGRAALFLIDGDRLKSWKATGLPGLEATSVESAIGGQDLLARAVQTGQSLAASPELPPPAFADLAPDRSAVAIPLTIDRRVVAVLYADPGIVDPPIGWAEGVDLIARHAAAVAALRVASRTLDLLRGDASDPASAADAAPSHDAAPPNKEDSKGEDGKGEEGARRYARLLVSEIKLYNEAAVRAGRQQRDLRQRLRAEIDRAQRLYEERVPPAVGARDLFFHQELVQTLAGGDPGLLGN